MKIQKSTFIVFLFSWLIAPAFAHAHSLNLLHYPLAPYSFQLWQDSYIFLAVPLMNLFVIALVLWLFIRQPGIVGNLWRAILLYAVASITQFAVLMGLVEFTGWGNPGWTSLMDAIVSLVIILAATLLIAFALGYILYKKFASPIKRIMLAVCSAMLAGYFIAAVTATLLLAIELGGR